MSCCGKNSHISRCRSNDIRIIRISIWEIAGELQQENKKGKILPKRLWDSSPMAAWVEGCRGAG